MSCSRVEEGDGGGRTEQKRKKLSLSLSPSSLGSVGSDSCLPIGPLMSRDMLIAYYEGGASRERSETASDTKGTI